MNRNALIEETKLTESIFTEKRNRDVAYLMELKTENLLFSHYAEAGLNGLLNYTVPAHGGWDSPTSQIRGTFVGHWLSAAARISNETADMQLLAKANFIVSEIGRCQEQNGNGWAFPIPEKYLHSIKAGKNFWAPQYVCHKNMMGLLDMYLFVGNKQALQIVCKCADWFYNFTNDITRETMDHMMDIQETGGMMELWCDLYAITEDKKHLELLHRYERPKLSERIYRHEDILTNVHANTTIPEVQGCARAYEVTGEEKYRKTVENYWDLAVTSRGTYASGGQTCGEVWTPSDRQSERLGPTNQEHCTVYNMIRIADYLYRWTGKSEYADYIELNTQNGILAQSFWQAGNRDTFRQPLIPEQGIVAYYLPLAAGSQKIWGTKTEDFWCCHCTAVQANAKFREYIYYKDDMEISIAQYIPSILTTVIENANVKITQTYAYLGGKALEVGDFNQRLDNKPDFEAYSIAVSSDIKKQFTVTFRIPWWSKSEVLCYVNDEKMSFVTKDGFAVINREWQEDKITIIISKGITCFPLSDRKDVVAFLDGPTLLAGLVEEQRTLYGDVTSPESMIRPHDVREWDSWMQRYQTVNQPQDFFLKPINEIGKEKYTVYFQVKNMPLSDMNVSPKKI